MDECDANFYFFYLFFISGPKALHVQCIYKYYKSLKRCVYNYSQINIFVYWSYKQFDLYIKYPFNILELKHMVYTDLIRPLPLFLSL